MNDQTPDAAREAVLSHDALADALLQMTREMAYPLASMRHLLKQSIRAEVAAVSRARDAEWREEVAALKVKPDGHPVSCQRETHPQRFCNCGGLDVRESFNAALDALIARMDTARAGGANG